MLLQTYTSKFFVGRGEELDRVKKAIKIASETGKGSLLTILGAPRSGKTWLVQTISDGIEVRAGDRSQVCKLISLGQRDFATPEMLAQALIAKIQNHLDKQVILESPTTEIISSLVSSADEKRNTHNLRGLVKTLSATPIIVIDDYHLFQEQNPHTDRWFLIQLTKFLIEAGFVVILSSRFALDSNPNRSPEEQVDSYNLPVVLRLQSFSVKEIEMLIQEYYPQSIDKSASAIRLYTWTGGHPGRCIDLLEAVVTGKSDDQLLALIDAALQKDFFADALPQAILIERRQAIELIERISILRVVTVKILEELQVPQFIRATDGPVHNLIKKLLRMEMISYVPEKGGYILENSLRMTFEKKLFCSDRKHWLQIHIQVYNLYQRWVKEYPYEPIAYLAEWFYHFLSITAVEKNITLQFNRHLTDFSQIIIFDDLGRKRLADSIAFDSLLQIQVIANQAQAAYKQITLWIESDAKGVSHMEYANEKKFQGPRKLVGEERQKQLEEILAALNAEIPRLILIIGNGGIGKTFMVKRILEGVKAPGMRDRFLVPDITNEDVDDNQFPQDSGYGYVDFTDANLRDPFWLLSHIARGLCRSAQQENLFSEFDKQKKAYYTTGNVFKLIENGRIAQQNVFNTWFDEYNQFARKSGRTIFLCFDTTERITNQQSAVIRLFFHKDGIGKLENTTVLLAGRQDNIWENRIIDETKVALGNVPPYELKPLNITDIQEYLKEISVIVSDDNLKDYEFISRGYPVILTVFARLPSTEKLAVIGQVKEKLPEKLETISQDDLLRLCFDEVSQKFITYQRNENTDPMNLYQILFIARRGLTPDLLAFLRGTLADRNVAENDMHTWYEDRFLLLKKFYQLGDSGERDVTLVFHDVVYEHAVALDKFFAQDNQSKLLTDIVNFYRHQLTHLENHPANINARPEKHRAIMLDLLYYEYILNPWDALALFARVLDYAYRHYDWLMVDILQEEWERFETDRAAQNFLGQKPRVPKQLVDWYIDLAKQRFSAANANKDVTKSLDDTLREMNMFTVKMPEQYQHHFSLLKLRMELAWCTSYVQNGNFTSTFELERMKKTMEQLIADFSLQDHHKVLLADTYSLRSQYWQVEQRWIWAVADLRQAIKIYRKQKMLLAESRCIDELIRLYLRYGMVYHANNLLTRSISIVGESGPDSLSHLFVKFTRGNLHAGHGNYRQAEEVFNGLLSGEEKTEFNRLPYHDRSVFWHDGVRVKMQSLLLSLTLRDADWESQLLLLEDRVEQANEFSNPVERIDLYLLKANFYLDVLCCRHLIPSISRKAKKLIEEVVKSLETANKLNDLQGIIEQHVPLSDFYAASARLALVQGEVTLANKVHSNLLASIEMIRDQERDQRKPDHGFEFVELPVHHLEFCRLEASYKLLAGHLALLEPVGDHSIEEKIGVALVQYLEALHRLADQPSQILTTIALEQIWFYLRNTQPDQKKLCKTVDAFIAGQQADYLERLLKSGLKAPCQYP